ncbi:MAG: hypothetical protein WCP85_21045 [Mariniphaga sp.]
MGKIKKKGQDIDPSAVKVYNPENNYVRIVEIFYSWIQTWCLFVKWDTSVI